MQSNYTQIPVQSVTANPVSISFQHESKAFTLHGIYDVNQLRIDSPQLQFQIMQNNTVPGEYRINYNPKGEEHSIAVYYGAKNVPGTPFKLSPKPVALEFQPGNKMFSLHNVHLPEELSVKSDTLPFKMFKDGQNPTTIHIMHQPGTEVHEVDITYRGKNVENGKFRLAPHPNLALTAPQYQQAPQQFQAPMMMAPQQMLQYPQQAFYPPPQHYQAAPVAYPMYAAQQGGDDDNTKKDAPQFQTPMMAPPHHYQAAPVAYPMYAAQQDGDDDNTKKDAPQFQTPMMAPPHHYQAAPVAQPMYAAAPAKDDKTTASTLYPEPPQMYGGPQYYQAAPYQAAPGPYPTLHRPPYHG